MNVELYLTSAPFAEAKLENKTVVVVDVLRASTSICAALIAGAKGVIPTEGPGEAGELHSKLGTDNTILAGERDGIRIDNFDLGNSPAEFTQEVVADKFVLMTTTNGTGLFKRAAKSSMVMAGGLVNASKIAEKISSLEKDLIIACSGRQGNFSIEDTLCGGLLIDLLVSKYQFELKLNDAAMIAVQLYHNNVSSLRDTIEKGEHAQFLISLGFKQDVSMSTLIDSMPVRPILKDGRLIRDDS
jgi:2-phosphosulfolactate phosphatase